MAKFVKMPDGNLINADHVAIVQALAGGETVNVHMAPFGQAKPQGPYRMTVDEFLAAAGAPTAITDESSVSTGVAGDEVEP